jgi:thymidylate synthase (FAD)
MLARPQVSIAGMADFLGGFSADLNFAQYLDDPTELPPGAQLCKTAGQVCYASFGVKRTYNADAARYFRNIMESGHGSVLEHASYTLLFFGISRSVTHELVRHRAGVGVSQISQRYVSGRVLRFVERPEYQGDAELHEAFERRIDAAAEEYGRVADRLMAQQKAGSEILSGEARTDLRKKVQQAARSVLPNETEAPIVVTANVRAWRHILEMRANPHAETEIRALAFRAYLCLVHTEPMLFGDYRVVHLPDGTYGVETDHPKV